MKNTVTPHNSPKKKTGTTWHRRKSSKKKNWKQSEKLKQLEQLTTSWNNLECRKTFTDDTWERTVQTWGASNWDAPSATLRERASAKGWVTSVTQPPQIQPAEITESIVEGRLQKEKKRTCTASTYTSPDLTGVCCFWQSQTIENLQKNKLNI